MAKPPQANQATSSEDSRHQKHVRLVGSAAQTDGQSHATELDKKRYPIGQPVARKKTPSTAASLIHN